MYVQSAVAYGNFNIRIFQLEDLSENFQMVNIRKEDIRPKSVKLAKLEGLKMRMGEKHPWQLERHGDGSIVLTI